MANTFSLPSTANSFLFNNALADDGAVARIRDGQSCILSDFNSLSFPAGATIDGIIVRIEGYALQTDHCGNAGAWIHLSNDGGTSWSVAKCVTDGDSWNQYAGGVNLESAGAEDNLWGESWNTTTASDIQVKLEWSTNNASAVYIDYVSVHVYYTAAVVPPSRVTSLKSGKMIVKGGIKIK